MKLTRMKVRHYKSLDDIKLDLSSRVTVLVGPNAVGKSNIVDCLRFVRDAVSFDLEHAVSARGGITRVRQYSKTKPYKVAVRLELAQDELVPEESSALPPPSEYEFSIESLSASNYVVDHEKAKYFTFDRSNDRTQRRIVEDGFQRNRSGHVGGPDEKFRAPTDQLAMGRSRLGFYSKGAPIERFISDWRFSSIYPNRLREPSLPDKDSVLAEDGRNWASVIKALRRSPRGRAALDRIAEAMRSVVPTFEDVAVFSAGSYLVPNFTFNLRTNDKVTFDPVQLSDGTLRVFGILLALYQVPAPRLLVIEEPEQTVHPGVLAVLAEAFKEASEVTQIIITTHSPNLIDHFSTDQVRVVALDDGLTTVAPLKKTQVEAVKRRLMTMQDFMLAEGLLPETT